MKTTTKLFHTVGALAFPLVLAGTAHSETLPGDRSAPQSASVAGVKAVPFDGPTPDSRVCVTFEDACQGSASDPWED